MEVGEELTKRRVDALCMQKVRWKGKGARFVGLRDEGTNCAGHEMMQDLEMESW